LTSNIHLVYIAGVLKRTTIFLTPGQVQRLALVAKRKGLKPAQLIRLYIDAGLGREERERGNKP
jgi:hypothetical protein